MDLASIKFNENFKHRSEKRDVVRSLAFPESDLWKFSRNPNFPRSSLPSHFVIALLFETSVESRSIPFLHLVLSALLNLLPDLGFLLVALPLLPCFSSWNSSWLKSSALKINKISPFEIKGKERKFNIPPRFRCIIVYLWNTPDILKILRLTTNFTALSENARLDKSLFISPLRLKFSFVILVKSIS